MNARAALSVFVVAFALTPFIACTTNSTSPPTATPAISSDIVPASDTAASASASSSAKPCFQRVMYKSGAHFDTVTCHCVASDAAP